MAARAVGTGWRRLLGTRLAPAGLIALAVALATPSLTVGLSADDWVHALIAEGRPLEGMPRSRLDLFTFADGSPAHAHALADQGVFPWWTDPEVRLAFFRPISSLTHLADFALWPGAPWAMHAHNLVWFALALLSAWAVYRRFLLPRWLAGLAFCLYALDGAHGPAVGWVANRNAMVAVALGLPALVLHDRWRRDGFGPGAWLAPAVLAIALLAGESALAVFAYVVAHAVVFESGWRRRLIACSPCFAAVIGWRAVHHLLGYGVARSGVYLDPMRDATAFARALPARSAALLSGQFALPWSDFTSLYGFVSPRAEHVMTAIAFATVALLCWTFADVLRRDSVARFFGLGLLLAVVPIASTFPADRLLWFVGVGAMALLARFLVEPKSWPRKLLAAPLFALHLVFAPPLLALRSRSMATVEKPLARAEQTLPGGPGIAEKTVILVNPPADLFAGYLQVTRAARREPRPARIRWLATGTSRVDVDRVDAATLRVCPRSGFVQNVSERMLRTDRAAFNAGWSLALTGVTIEVLSVDLRGRPLEALFRFAEPLEHPSLVWVKWGEHGYEPFALPPVGGRVTLPPIDFLAAVFAEER